MELLANMELFVAVAKAKGFRRAAEILDMPNSTLSRRIADLERLVGVRLFHRTTRKVELTEAGQAYFRRCEGIVAEAHVAHEALLEGAEQPGGVLRVSMPVDLALSYLAPAIKEFGERYPLIDFELDLTPRRIDLVADGFDCAIRMGEPVAMPASLIAKPIGLLPRHLCASSTYLAGAPPLRHPRDLAQHQCLLIQTPLRQQAQWKLISETETVTIAVKGRYAMNNVGLSRTMAILGMGIAVSAGRETPEDIAAGLQCALPDWRFASIPVYAIIESRLIPSRVRLFINHISESLAAHA
ncbi:Transcriptional regulator [Collimonas arenae]|uniref:Transcriptional regulator n=1 Tax=Collimonas arenae TaxID=279058 RepID=A0A0A1F3W1_9BURK|nr:LysR family transcriptional regulator [Collimonas arenae]AIY39403.1 Transcriptional regulator [Collimonas arenae]